AVAALALAAASAESAALADAKGSAGERRHRRAEDNALRGASEAARGLEPEASFTGCAKRAAALLDALSSTKGRAQRAHVSIAFALDDVSARRLDVASSGIEPLSNIARFAGFGRTLTEHARAGLEALGYEPKAIARLALHAEGRRTLKGAPGIDVEKLRAKGL